MESDEALVAAINAERGAQDVTLQQLADMTGISYQSVQRYLDNKRPIRQPDVIKIAKALDVKISELWLEAEKRMAKANAQAGVGTPLTAEQRAQFETHANELIPADDEDSTSPDQETPPGDDDQSPPDEGRRKKA